MGAGIEAEHWVSTPAPAGTRRVALDPLLTAGMVASGPLAALPAGIWRVGGEIVPECPLERGRRPSYLPFSDAVFEQVHCGFLLHLYLEITEALAGEVYRVLAPGGTCVLLLPDLRDGRTEAAIRHTQRAFGSRFGAAAVTRYPGPFTTFWSDLYRDRTWRVACVRPA